MEYFNAIRLEKAKELLVSTNMDIADIVSRIGYVDVPALSENSKRALASRLESSENCTKTNPVHVADGICQNETPLSLKEDGVSRFFFS